MDDTPISDDETSNGEKVPDDYKDFKRYLLDNEARISSQVEFADNSSEEPDPTRVADPISSDEFTKHRTKNWYPDVKCYKWSRVKLENNRYIHASEFTLPHDTTRYILTQAPMEKTVVDFWEVIYQVSHFC